MRHFTLSLAVLAALTAGPALAERYERQETTTVITGDDMQVYQEGEKLETPAAASFKEADTDGNGYLDHQEARDVGLLEFTDADGNGDGRIDPIEYALTP